MYVDKNGSIIDGGDDNDDDSDDNGDDGDYDIFYLIQWIKIEFKCYNKILRMRYLILF